MTNILTLRQFVLESNAIEGVHAQEGDPLFDNHLAAARLIEDCAQNGTLVMPLTIHDIVLPQEAGYRKDHAVIVDGKTEEILNHLPPPECIHELMFSWLSSCSQWHEVIIGSEGKPSPCKGDHWHRWISNRAWYLHHWLLCIHPFADGNGRTSRLFLNSFRSSSGLPWRRVSLESNPNYYTYIREFEDRTFRGWYCDRPWAYIEQTPAA